MPDEQDKDVIIAHLRAEIARKDQQIELLTQKVDALVKRIFGSSSEKLEADQLLLFEVPKKPEGDGPAPEVEPSPKNKRAKRISREATLPANLPVEETILIP